MNEIIITFGILGFLILLLKPDILQKLKNATCQIIEKIIFFLICFLISVCLLWLMVWIWDYKQSTVPNYMNKIPEFKSSSRLKGDPLLVLEFQNEEEIKKFLKTNYSLIWKMMELLYAEPDQLSCMTHYDIVDNVKDDKVWNFIVYNKKHYEVNTFQTFSNFFKLTTTFGREKFGSWEKTQNFGFIFNPRIIEVSTSKINADIEYNGKVETCEVSTSIKIKGIELFIKSNRISFSNTTFTYEGEISACIESYFNLIEKNSDFLNYSVL